MDLSGRAPFGAGGLGPLAYHFCDEPKLISDKARQLRRSLAVSFEDWPRGPRTMVDLLSWAHKVTRSFDATEAALTELVELRPEASRKVQQAIGAVKNRQ